ncbi:MAG: CAP domain-containing protein [Planctomycetota bacterium]|jgi:uncharacterized protein YkwD
MGGRKESFCCLSLLALGFCFAACASVGPLDGPPPPDVLSGSESAGVERVHDCSRSLTAVADATLESRVYVLANRIRETAGLEALDLRLDLMEAARRHALDMASRGYFAHVSPEGDGPGERADRQGTRFVAFAENLARVRNSNHPATLALREWLKSPGHRRNLLDESERGYRYTGVGAARASDGTVLIAQVFLR